MDIMLILEIIGVGVTILGFIYQVVTGKWQHALVLAIVLFMGCTGLSLGIGMLSNSGTTLPPGTNPTSIPLLRPTRPPESTRSLINLEPALRTAIRLASSAEADATFRLDEGPLYRAFIGEALRAEISSVEELRNYGLYLVSHLEHQEFHTFEVAEDGTSAVVYLTETWSIEVMSSESNECLLRYPLHEVPQTVYLIYTESGWMVEAIIFDSDEEPFSEEC